MGERNDINSLRNIWTVQIYWTEIKRDFNRVIPLWYSRTARGGLGSGRKKKIAGRL